MRQTMIVLFALCVIGWCTFVAIWSVEMIRYENLPELVATRESIAIHQAQLDKAKKPINGIFASLLGMALTGTTFRYLNIRE